MSDTAVSSTPTTEPTLPGTPDSSTIGSTETTPLPEETTTTTPPPEETTTPPPPPETTTPPPPETTPPPPPPPETTTSTPDPITETTSTTEEPPSTTTTEESSSTTETSTEPTTEPESSTTPPLTVVTVTPTGGDTTITITTTSVNTDQSTTGLPSSSTQVSSSSSSSTISATALPSTGGGGLSQPAKIAIAIIIPIFAVILIAFLGIFFWRRYKKRKDSEEMRRKEVEEYGYNPNNDVSGPGPAVVASASGTNQGSEMAEMEAGYRGWGNTAGGRKASAPLSASAATTNPAGAGYGNTPYSGAVATGGQQYPSPQQPELYGSPAATGVAPIAAGAAVLGAAHSEEEAKQNRDRHSHSPLLSSPTNRPSTADSSTIGAPATTGPSELDDGLHRGDSVASSRYTNATRQSEDSGAHDAPGNNGFRNTYVSDGNDYYNDVANPYAGDYEYHEHAPEQGYHQPPMIQQVGARRNTRIENPSDTHYAQMPRQGTSGIAQNF